jgi:hypothetical protein
MYRAPKLTRRETKTTINRNIIALRVMQHDFAS